MNEQLSNKDKVLVSSDWEIPDLQLVGILTYEKIDGIERPVGYTWGTKADKRLNIRDMDNNHLSNSIRMIVRNAEKHPDKYDSLGSMINGALLTKGDWIQLLRDELEYRKATNK